jgi:membrane-anchored mycosin MYCP
MVRVAMMFHRLSAAAATVVAVMAVVPPTPAWAIHPYEFNIDVDIAPPDSPPSPPFPMQQRYRCATSGRLADSQFDSIPIDTVWDVPRLHTFATGRGQAVAVIDSGVNRNDRLPQLFGGGDYIMGGDGLGDCDHHGTLVAGIIAASARPTDGFVGIAPDAAIISIRQSSNAFKVDSSQDREAREAAHAATLTTLARAIVHAAALNATVINISATACQEVTRSTDLHELAGALYYAAVVKDAVIVTSAGNLQGDCAVNPGPDPAHPDDPRGWGAVQVLSLPSLFTDFTLSVGGTTLRGDPYPATMPGPWVGVAAPAVSVVSLDPSVISGELVNSEPTKEEVQPIAGTSFAAANVSGLAALIRQRYPQLSAHQVIERIKRTAHTPSEAVESLLGYGPVDPLAALTAPVDDSIPMVAANIPSVQAVPDPPPPPADMLARTVAWIAVGALAAVLFIGGLVAVARGGSGRGQ